MLLQGVWANKIQSMFPVLSIISCHWLFTLVEMADRRKLLYSLYNIISLKVDQLTGKSIFICQEWTLAKRLIYLMNSE